MKLFTHNMLTSRCLKGVLSGYPLELIATNVQIREIEFKPEFIIKMISKLDWNVFVDTANKLGYGTELPKSNPPENFNKDDEFLKKVHHALFEVDVEEGELICPETKRKFPITKGIPNMLINE
ncbi:unnamed protein product, partial [Gordionus sp. m RMFG-2023]